MSSSEEEEVERREGRGGGVDVYTLTTLLIIAHTQVTPQTLLSTCSSYNNKKVW